MFHMEYFCRALCASFNNTFLYARQTYQKKTSVVLLCITFFFFVIACIVEVFSLHFSSLSVLKLLSNSLCFVRSFSVLGAPDFIYCISALPHSHSTEKLQIHRKLFAFQFSFDSHWLILSTETGQFTKIPMRDNLIDYALIVAMFVCLSFTYNPKFQHWISL